MKNPRRFLAPEVVQTSAMDCGPASLKCFLEGSGIRVSYGRLREACQTDVDGTSIDTMEEVANQLGLQAEQTLMPVDHVLIPEADALPAIVVVRLPNGANHFVVVWRRHGPLVQVMDPATGRRWLACDRFVRDIYSHLMAVPADAWRSWAGSEAFTSPLRRRLSELGIADIMIDRLMTTALSDPGWRSLAALDAATRMAWSLVQSGAVRRKEEAATTVEGIFDRTRKEGADQVYPTPASYWAVAPGPLDDEGNQYLFVRGAIIVRARGIQPRDTVEQIEELRNFSPELAAALEEPPARPLREVIHALKGDGLFSPAAICLGLAAAAAGLVFEALLFRGLLDISRELGVFTQRLGAAVALIVFAIALLLLDLPLTDAMQRMGRRVETRLRLAFLRKLPRLGDRYFHSRLSSDLAERCHSLYVLRLLPAAGGQLVRQIFGLLLTTAGIAWLDPGSAGLAIAASAFGVALPLITQPSLAERDLRVRTHVGALSRFYLDAMLGLLPIRTHGAERALRREHEKLLVEWTRAGLSLQRRIVLIQAIQSLVGVGLAVTLLATYLARAADAGSVLLLLYWGLSLPVLGQQISMTLLQYPIYRNTTMRITEMLGAKEEIQPDRSERREVAAGNESDPSPGVKILFEGVAVRAAGHTILQDIDFEIRDGAHVAIVGASGAGKSSLVGLLLGWHRPAHGHITVDGLPLDATRLVELRKQTAWVDPAVTLWNRSLFDNLRFGSEDAHYLPIGEAIELAELGEVLKKLPQGMQTDLGEGGALVSGGEGQRVRLARAMLRRKIRLVILDEPFRGLDRTLRRELLQNARQLWREATLLCITHDISETASFDRVLVIDSGHVVEDGKPAELLADSQSRYSRLLNAEKELFTALWGAEAWRRVTMENGCLMEKD